MPPSTSSAMKPPAPDPDARPEGDPLVTRACGMLAAAEEPPTLAALAAALGLSGSQLRRRFLAATGLTPAGYAAALRAGRVREALAAPDARITDAIVAAGYGSGSRFYERADALLGMTPTAYRRGGTGAEIHFALGQCSLGAVLVATTALGVCAISLGDDPETLVHDLERRFPRAHLVGGNAGYEALVARVVGFVDAPQQGLGLPLDVRGTAFQQRVWEALRRIPLGQTTSYAAIARAIGAPRAVRAVGRAVGANPVAVAIPCHRVIHTDGSISGYRWGVARKRALLAKEAGKTRPTGRDTGPGTTAVPVAETSHG